MGTMWIFGETVQCSSEHFTTTVTEGNGSSVTKTKMTRLILVALLQKQKLNDLIIRL
jgi:hypothetical protein